ncbi:MAG TPA: MarR family transcriptional regulator [Candidatus Limnocylindrales bacterium]|jgi:Transcriptional regulators|nr:MarR family transcriptional regulator [Candidatus Limnocylindrales bacterium]
MSRRSRSELAAEVVEEIRGWQLDQDLLDEAIAADWGVSRTEGRVIDIVDRAGRITAGQLGAEVRLTSGAVTAVVDRLEAAGLVRRVRDTADRRRVFVEVTPKVEELAAPVFGPLAEEGHRAMTAYNDAELELIIRFIRASRDLLKRHATRTYELMEQGKEPRH